MKTRTPPLGLAIARHAAHSEQMHRPMDVAFSPDGAALYVVDFGKLEMTENGPKPTPGSGRLWRVVRETRDHPGPPANLRVEPAARPSRPEVVVDPAPDDAD